LTTANENAELSAASLDVPKEVMAQGEEEKATGSVFDVKYNCSKLKENGKWWDDVAFEIKEA